MGRNDSRMSSIKRRIHGWLAAVLASASFIPILPAFGASGPPSKPIPPTYFGLHAQKVVVPPRLQMPPAPWPTIPFSSFRLWSIPDWFQINGMPGQQYNWKAIDLFLDLAEKNKVNVLYTMGHTPRWASSDPDDRRCPPAYSPGGCDPPKDLNSDGSGSNQAFRDFVTALAKHAKGRIQNYEGWNEPEGNQWRGSQQQLVRMAKDMNSIVKEIDPSANILTPACLGAPRDNARCLDEFLRAGGGQYVDVISFHGYLWPKPPVPERIVDLIQALHEVMDRNGQSSKPLWDTEGGWGRREEYPNPDLQAAFLARMYLLQWSLGVERFYWFTWSHYPAGTLYDIETNQLTMAGVAYKQMYDWLVGATQSEACREKGGVWTCGYTRPDGYQAQAVWDASLDISRTKPYSAPQQFTRCRDLDGNVTDISKSHSVPISQKPVLLETGPPTR